MIFDSLEGPKARLVMSLDSLALLRHAYAYARSLLNGALLTHCWQVLPGYPSDLATLACAGDFRQWPILDFG